MGHLVNPHLFRLNYVVFWSSSIVTKKKFSFYFDLKNYHLIQLIENFFKKNKNIDYFQLYLISLKLIYVNNTLNVYLLFKQHALFRKHNKNFLSKRILKVAFFSKKKLYLKHFFLKKSKLASKVNFFTSNTIFRKLSIVSKIKKPLVLKKKKKVQNFRFNYIKKLTSYRVLNYKFLKYFNFYKNMTKIFVKKYGKQKVYKKIYKKFSRSKNFISIPLRLIYFILPYYTKQKNFLKKPFRTKIKRRRLRKKRLKRLNKIIKEFINYTSFFNYKRLYVYLSKRPLIKANLNGNKSFSLKFKKKKRRRFFKKLSSSLLYKKQKRLNRKSVIFKRLLKTIYRAKNVKKINFKKLKYRSFKKKIISKYIGLNTFKNLDFVPYYSLKRQQKLQFYFSKIKLLKFKLKNVALKPNTNFFKYKGRKKKLLKFNFVNLNHPILFFKKTKKFFFYSNKYKKKLLSFHYFRKSKLRKRYFRLLYPFKHLFVNTGREIYRRRWAKKNGYIKPPLNLSATYLRYKFLKKKKRKKKLLKLKRFKPIFLQKKFVKNFFKKKIYRNLFLRKKKKTFIPKFSKFSNVFKKKKLKAKLKISKKIYKLKNYKLKNLFKKRRFARKKSKTLKLRFFKKNKIKKILLKKKRKLLFKRKRRFKPLVKRLLIISKSKKIFSSVQSKKFFPRKRLFAVRKLYFFNSPLNRLFKRRLQLLNKSQIYLSPHQKLKIAVRVRQLVSILYCTRRGIKFISKKKFSSKKKRKPKRFHRTFKFKSTSFSRSKKKRKKQLFKKPIKPRILVIRTKLKKAKKIKKFKLNRKKKVRKIRRKKLISKIFLFHQCLKIVNLKFKAIAIFNVLFSYKINLNLCFFIKKFWTSFVTADMIAELFILRLLQKYLLIEIVKPLLRYLKRAIFKKKIYGFALLLMGRFSRKDRATYKWYKKGPFTKSNKLIYIDYSNKKVYLRFSTCSFKISLIKTIGYKKIR